MELILLENVQNLGKLGDKVTVKPGYGRNFLVPQGKAVPATRENVEAFEKKRAELEARAAELLAAAEARRDAVDGQSVTIVANASSEGKLYGSVGPREVADALTISDDGQVLLFHKRQNLKTPTGRFAIDAGDVPEVDVVRPQ